MDGEVAAAARKAVSGTMPTSTAAIEQPDCGHCGLPISGYGTATTGEKLCHPDKPGMDCYHLVTALGHEMPCPYVICVMSARLRKVRESGGTITTSKDW